MRNTLSPNRSKRLSFEKRLLAYFLGVLLMVLSILFLYANVSKQSKITNQWVRHTEAVLTELDSTMLLHQDVVAATDRFMLTGEKSFLQGREERLKLVAQSIESVKRSIGNDALQQKRLDTLQEALQSYWATSQTAINLRQQRLFKPEDSVPLISRTEQQLTPIRTLFKTLAQQEKSTLRQRQALFLQSASNVLLTIRILLLLFVLSFVAAAVIVYRNMVRRNKAEAGLLKNEELTRNIIDHSPVLINVKDLTGKYLLVNNQFAVAVKQHAGEMIGKRAEDLLPAEVSDVITRADREVQQTLEPLDFLLNIPQPEGLHTFIVTKFPLHDENGNLYAIGSSYVDITPIKSAHEKLEKSFLQQQQILNGLQQVLSASSDLICIIKENDEFFMVSDTVNELLGYSPKELMSKRYLDFVAEEDKPETIKIAQAIKNGRPVSNFLNHYLKKDGSKLPIFWSAKWLPEDKMMFCIARNGSEQIRTAQALVQSQSQLAHAQKIAMLGSWDWDIRHKAWACSEGIFALLGIEKDPGQDMQQLVLKAIHPDDRRRVLALRKEALTTGKRIDIEHRIIRTDAEVRYVHSKGEVHLDERGAPDWFSGTMQDITERKQAELTLQQLNSDLEKRAEELKASNAELERFAYVASHDLQEPLRMVTSFLGLLQKRIGEQLDDTSKTFIHYAVDGAERMKGLIRDLLQFSRLGTSKEDCSAVDLNALMVQTLTIFDVAIKESGAEVQIAPLPTVTGNKTQLQQLFQNLLGNALKYRGTQKPVIAVDCTENETEWQFAVRDNGIGIDPRYFEKIFILFQRLHQRNEFSGNGIGLAICKKIVERHGGRIWVQSQPGQGSTFYFTLNKESHA